MTLFSDLTEEERQALLARAERRHYEAEEVVVEEGVPHRAIFLLRSGRVRVLKEYLGQPVPINELWPGEVFGELSFVEDSAASASVVAVEPVEVDVLKAETVLPLLEAEPHLAGAFYRSLALALAGRLRYSTEQRVVLPFSSG